MWGSESVRRAAVILAMLVSTLAPGSASAQTDDERAAARAAATEGLKAFQAGRYQDAVDYCKKAEALMHAPTHLLLIARAQTKLGHLVEAQEAYFRITRDTLSPGAPRAFVDAQASAADEQAALAPRIPTLKVTIEGAAPKDVALNIDGQAVAAAVIGLARPIDPGQHTVSAKSASAESETSTVMIPEGGAQSVTLTIHPVASSAGASGTESSSAESGEQPSGNTGLRVAGWIGVGVGVAGAALGTVFLMSNRSDINDANALCSSGSSTQCPASKRDQIDKYDSDASSAATLAWVSYGVGVAGLVTGVVLLVKSKAHAPAQTASVTPWIGPTSAGLSGTF